MSQQVRVRSRWWYLLPIFFDIIGGVIAYFVLRDDDPKKAKNCLWLGIILIAVEIGLFAVFLSICTSIGPCAEFHDEFMSGMGGFVKQEDLMTQTQLMQQLMMQSPQHREQMMNQMLDDPELRNQMMQSMIGNQQMMEQMNTMMNDPDLRQQMMDMMIQNPEMMQSMMENQQMMGMMMGNMSGGMMGQGMMNP